MKLVYADDGSIGWFDALSTSGTQDWEYVEILIKKFDAVGAVSVVLNVIGGIRNAAKYGWREGLGRTGFDVAGAFASAWDAAVLGGIVCSSLMPVAAATVGGVIGYGIGLFVENRVDSIKRSIYGR